MMTNRQDNMAALEIAFCMGSSCFSRGGNQGLALIQTYLKTHRLEHRVKLSGHLCQGRCQTGPNIVIDGEAYPETHASVVLDLLKQHLESQSEGGEQP